MDTDLRKDWMMPLHTNEPQPFLLEIIGLKPLTFGEEVGATGVMAAPDALKTQPHEIDPLPPIRQVAETEDVDVWQHAVVVDYDDSTDSPPISFEVDEEVDDLI